MKRRLRSPFLGKIGLVFEKVCIFAKNLKAMFETSNLNIDGQTLNKAYLYAQAHGIDLSAAIESFLLQFSMGKTNNVRNRKISKEVMDLAGSLPSTHVSDDWKAEKEAYLMEKYA